MAGKEGESEIDRKWHETGVRQMYRRKQLSEQKNERFCMKKQVGWL